MSESVILEKALEDPLLSKFELGHRRLYYPLGLPLEVLTNSLAVIDAAAQNWGDFSQSFDRPPMRIALGVREGADTEPLPPKSNFVSREHLMAIVANANNLMMCDFEQAYSFGWITPALASDSDALRYRFLTPAAAMMAQHVALAVLHGALIARGDAGVVLCGESFAGKSTLAYAAARAGWTYLTDDGTFLVRDRSDLYAVGNPHFIRFREDARELFPELAGRLSVARPNGKMGIEVFTRDLAITTAPGTRIDHVVMLARDRSGPVRLHRYPRDQMETWCQQYVTFGSKEARLAQARCHQRLLDAPLWEMSYSNFDDAVRRLEHLVDFGG